MLDKMESTFLYLVPNFCHKVELSPQPTCEYKGSSATSPVTEAVMEPSIIQPIGESFDAAALSGLARHFSHRNRLREARRAQGSRPRVRANFRSKTEISAPQTPASTIDRTSAVPSPDTSPM